MAEEAAPGLGGGSALAHHHVRPQLRISQVLSACAFCKTRKIKVRLSVAPACGGCTKFGRSATCSLASAAASQLTRDYPSYLQDRIARLQSQLQRVQNGDERPRRSAPSDHRQHLAQAVQDTPTSVDTLIADIGAVPVLASSYSAAGDGPTLSSILLGAAAKQGFPSLEAVQTENTPASLPRRDVALRLVQHYVDHVYPRLPFFSLQGFWAQFNSVYTSSSGPIDQHNPSGPGVEQGYSTFTVLIVLAIASSSLSRSADSVVSSRAQHLFNAALEYRESAVLPNTIVGVQSLLFLIQYATLNPSVLDAWYLTGVGIRSCVDLGLHQDPRPLDSVSTSLLETRRRLWWSMYSFDRSISLGCGRPIGISDSVITSQLPTFRIESMATEDQVQGYLQRYRALQIQSQIYEQLDKVPGGDRMAQRAVSDLVGKLDSWSRGNLPEYDQTLIESEWLMGRMLLYRPCRLIPERSHRDLQWLWEIASEKLYWAGLAALHSFWKLRSAGNDGESEPIQQLDLWNVVQDILYSIRTLSERWDDGKILAHDLELASKGVLRDQGEPAHIGDDAFPSEVKNFADYISLTSMRAAQAHEGASSARGVKSYDGELRQLVSDML
ncbi:fungal specific transcription factor domain-containing protein [Sarocladium implicatum]|nr:fungal specific transcription factor domain-containing protein [Sarocladium implicatum]